MFEQTDTDFITRLYKKLQTQDMLVSSFITINISKPWLPVFWYLSNYEPDNVIHMLTITVILLQN